MEYLYLAIILIVLLPPTVYGKIVINEFSPERSPQAVELVNTSSESAILSNWYIDDNGGTSYYAIASGTTIYPNSCVVFEGDFNLNKSSADMVRLFDGTAPPTSAAAILVDSYGYKQGPGTGQSYIRTPDGSGGWITASSSFGQWNDTNSNCVLLPTLTPAVAPTETPSPAPPSATPTPRPVPNRIFISEVYPYPAPGESEWIELYNDNDTGVTLDGWYIDDAENSGGTPRNINVSLTAHGFAAVDISGSLFNNDSDSVRLLNPDKQMADGFEYGKARRQMSLGRLSFDSETVCLQEPSKGNVNGSCAELSPTASPTTALPTSQPAGTSTSLLPAVTQIPAPLRNEINAPFASVLGVNTQFEEVQAVSRPAAPATAIPISYSILTIVSLLIKIKNGLTA